MKNTKFLIVILTALLLAFVSCDNTPEDQIGQKNLRYVLSYDGAATTLEHDSAVDWYSCSDQKGSNPQYVLTTQTLQVAAFSEPGIRFYKAKAESSETIYVVSYTGLPVMYIDTDSGEPVTSRDDYADAHVKLLSEDFDAIDKDISIKGRGNASWYSALKKSYNIKFDKKTSVLGMEKGKKWCLISNYFDATLMRNKLASDIARNIFDGQDWIPSYMYCELVVNGEYLGNYMVAEAVVIDSKRLDIEDLEDSIENLIDNSNPDLTGLGYVLEVDKRQDSEHVFISSFGHPFCLSEPDLDDYTPNQVAGIVNAMKTKVDAFEAVLSDNGFKTMTLAELGDYIDVDSFVSWFINEELAKNLDSNFYTSVKMYVDSEDGLINMGPNWDFDHAYGAITRNIMGTEVSSPKGLWIPLTQTEAPSWYMYLLNNDAFRQKVIDELNAKKTSALAYIHNRIEELKQMTEVSGKLNLIRWVYQNKTNKIVFKTRDEHIDYLKSWIDERYNNIVGELLNYDKTYNKICSKLEIK